MSKSSSTNKIEYNPNKIESKWQQIWEKEKIFSPDLRKAKKPFYNLMMFPYPSAEGLHVGNMYAFTGADVYGRYQRMKGNDVFEPIGLDGFGIHSENYAIKVGKHPREQAEISEKNFYRQLRATGNAYDWSRTLETYDPDYYRWTQWIFIQMFKKGLAYRKKAQVNWCPSCKTVLADEQVLQKFKNQKSKIKNTSEKSKVNGVSVAVCERCETEVEKRNLEQWFFKITEYADRLLSGLDKIDWPEKIKIAQKLWIGKKTGININYKVEGSNEKIKVFTTRPDTNFGATFIALAPEHPLALKLATPESKKDIERYINVSKKKTDRERRRPGGGSAPEGKEEGREKTGVFTGFYAINDLTGYKMPIWVSDFVLMEFGTGAVVGVPGHDKRDFEFAQKFGLKIIRVVVGTNGDSSDITKIEQVQEERGKMVNSDFLNGMDIHEATTKIMDYMEEKGHGKREVTYHLRDWLISRQRYWGPPIPIIYCRKCWERGIKSIKSTTSTTGDKALDTRDTRDTRGTLREGLDYAVIDGKEHMIHPVPEEDLPVLLPDVKDWRPKGTGTSPLANHPEFYETKCPNCSSAAKRETDVSDTFLDSSWYYLRYLSVPTQSSKLKAQNYNSKLKNDAESAAYDIDIVRKWCPVKIYIGGAEHSVLHLLYVRFIAMVLHDLKDSKLKNLALPFQEPFPRFFAHGLLISQGAKMSKSRGNVIVPDDYIKKFGADTLRLYLMFLGPFDHGGDFQDTGIEGMNRFVKRVWKLLQLSVLGSQLSVNGQSVISSSVTDKPKTGKPHSENRKQKTDDRLRIMHKTIKAVTQDIESFSYNTAIARMMEWYNFLFAERQKETSDMLQVTSKQKDRSSNVKGQMSKVSFEEARVFLKLLAPFAPHFTEELWQRLAVSGSQLEKNRTNRQAPIANSIHFEDWPEYDQKYLVQEKVTVVVQVNGKRRGEISIEYSVSSIEYQKEIEEMARKEVEKYVKGKTVKNVIYVAGRIVNFVI